MPPSHGIEQEDQSDHGVYWQSLGALPHFIVEEFQAQPDVDVQTAWVSTLQGAISQLSDEALNEHFEF